MHPRVAVMLGFAVVATSSSLFVLPSRSPALAGYLWHGPAAHGWLPARDAAARQRLAPGHAVVEYRLPRPGAFPHDPAVAPDGSVWYTDQANSFIGRLDPATGKVSDWPTPTKRMKF